METDQVFVKAYNFSFEHQCYEISECFLAVMSRKNTAKPCSIMQWVVSTPTRFSVCHKCDIRAGHHCVLGNLMGQTPPPLAIYKSLKGCRREYFVLRSKSWLRLSSFDSSFASCVVELVRFASCIDITWDILLSLLMPTHDRSSSQASKADNNVDIPSYVPICYPLDKVD